MVEGGSNKKWQIRSKERWKYLCDVDNRKLDWYKDHGLTTSKLQTQLLRTSLTQEIVEAGYQLFSPSASPSRAVGECRCRCGIVKERRQNKREKDSEMVQVQKIASERKEIRRSHESWGLKSKRTGLSKKGSILTWGGSKLPLLLCSPCSCHPCWQHRASVQEIGFYYWNGRRC